MDIVKAIYSVDIQTGHFFFGSAQFIYNSSAIQKECMLCLKMIYGNSNKGEEYEETFIAHYFTRRFICF